MLFDKPRNKKEIILFIGLCLLGLIIGLIINNLLFVAILVILPIILSLLLKPKLALSIFVACIPLEYTFPSDIYSLPKITGAIAFISFFIYTFRKKIVVKWDSALTFMVLYLLFGCISIFWSINISYSLTAVSTYFFLTILYFLIINLVQTKDDINQLMVYLFWGSILLIISVLIQWYELGFSDTTRIAGISLNSNYLGALFILALLSTYWLIINRNTFYKYFAFITLIFAIFCIIASQSRGSIISFGLLGVLFLLISKRKFSVFVILLFIIFLFINFAPDELWTRFLYIGNENGVDRFRDLWPLGIELIKNNPLIGYGLGTNGLAIASLFNRNLSVHNGLLAVLIDTGIIGTFFYLCFLSIVILKILRCYVNYHIYSNRIYLFIQFLLITLISYFTIWIKSGGAEYDKVLWVLLGLASILPSILKKK